LDPDVCEAAGLAHDLGHPPFGHNGEKTLDLLALGRDEEFGSSVSHFDGYEGNAQSLRIIATLAVRSADYAGLNLTAATLRACLKYPWLRAAHGKKHEKFSVYTTEQPLFEWVFQGLPADEQTLEAQIMDWADDVAYSVHDLYDFALAGVIPLHLLSDVSGSELKALLMGNKHMREVSTGAFDSVVAALNLLPPVQLTTTSRSSSRLIAAFKEWVSAQIARFAAIELSVAGSPGERTLVKGGTTEDEVAILKALTYHCAIGSPALAVRQIGERAILRGLFKILLVDARGSQRLMSDEARSRLEDGVAPERVVLDTISSMTDAQAAAMHHKLAGNSPASVLDLTTPSVL
jgi:dGTPase